MTTLPEMKKKPQPVPVILAAGLAARFGGQKLGAPLFGKPLLTHLLDRLANSSLPKGVVVHRPGDLLLTEEVQRAGLVSCPVPSPSLSASIAAGVRAAGDAPGYLILLGDQPLIDLSHLEALLSVWREGTAAVFSDGGKGPQPPALFDRSLRDDLLALSGDTGARHLAGQLGSRARVLSFSPGVWSLDVDTPEDLESVRRALQEEAP